MAQQIRGKLLMVAKKQVGPTGNSKAALLTSAATFVAPKGVWVTGAMLNAWVNQHAGGQWANVQFVPAANVKLANKYTQQGQLVKPLPFGYAGQPTGVRATYQNFYLYGLQTAKGITKSLAAIHATMRKTDGHSLTKLMCLCAMFNGGYTQKGASGVAYGTLVATVPTKA